MDNDKRKTTTTTTSGGMELIPSEDGGGGGLDEDSKRLNAYNASILKRDIIKAMQGREDVFHRYFDYRQKLFRRFILRKLYTLIIFNYGRDGSDFVFDEEMINYYRNLTEIDCETITHQDFFLFCGLAFCPEFFEWFKLLHNRPFVDKRQPLSQLTSEKDQTNMKPSQVISRFVTPVRALNKENAERSDLGRNQMKLAHSKPSSWIDFVPKQFRDGLLMEEEEISYVDNHHFRIWDFSAFVDWINNCVMKEITNAIMGKNGANTFSLDSLVRDISAKYVTFCRYPRPPSSQLTEWTKRLDSIIASEQNRNCKNDGIDYFDDKNSTMTNVTLIPLPPDSNDVEEDDADAKEKSGSSNNKKQKKRKRNESEDDDDSDDVNDNFAHTQTKKRKHSKTKRSRRCVTKEEDSDNEN